MTVLTSPASRASTSVARWLDERLVAGVSFRLRLLRMALRPVDRIPALVVMALESPHYEAGVPLDPAPRSAEIGPVR